MIAVLLKRARLALIAVCLIASPAGSAEHWVAAWAAPPDQAGPPLEAVTLRQTVRPSVAGRRLRLTLSNLYGEEPLLVGPVRVAKSQMGSAVRPGTDQAVTFGGDTRVILAPGGEAVSDPIALSVAAFEDIAVSLYLPRGASAPTLHGVAMETAFIAPGDATAAVVLPSQKSDDARYVLTDLAVDATAAARALVVVGDSLTDGVGSTANADRRWTDRLAMRLQAEPRTAGVAVVNSGISGNRILSHGASPFLGPSVLARFDRDVLSKPGARWVLLLHGVNDINAGNVLPKEHVSADQVIHGMKTLIARAQARGLDVWGGTLLPNEGVKWGFWSEAGERDRLAVNAWIRASGAFDRVIDFDRAVRDPAYPSRLRPEFDSGDHLHLNDTGYAAMAAAIDLRLFGTQAPHGGGPPSANE